MKSAYRLDIDGLGGRVILPAMAMLLLALAAIYAFPAQPMWDDYCRAALEPDGIAYAVWNYLNWCGRWLSMFLYGQFLAGSDFTLYPLVVIASLFMWVSAFALVASIIFPARKWTVALLLTAVIWAGAPVSAELFYWATGITEYGLSFFAVVLTGYLVLRKRHWLAAPLGFAVGGIHELAAVVLCCGLTMFILLTWKNRSNGAIVVLAFAIAGLLTNALAPGNALRAEQYEHAGVARLLYTVIKPFDGPVEWLTDPRLIFLAIFLMLSRDVPKWTENVGWWQIPLAGIVTVAAPFALVSFLQGGQPSGGRIDDFLFATGLPFVLGSALVLRRYLPDVDYRVLQSVTAAIFAVSLFTAQNTAHAIQDLPDAFGPWKAQIDARVALLNSQRGAASLGLPEVTITPRVYLKQNSADPVYFGNVCMAQYYGIGQIVEVPRQPAR